MATDWTVSLFDCCSPFDVCLEATFCPCFLFGKTQARQKDPTLQNHSSFNGSCMAFCGLSMCYLGPLLLWAKRGDTRERYNIAGSCLEDCATACCCSCCMLAQEEKEVTLRNEKGGYTMQQPMGYPAQQPQAGPEQGLQYPQHVQEPGVAYQQVQAGKN